MKLSCSVAQDLLPLYHDGVCCDESRLLVEEHLEHCADCKDMLHLLKEDVEVGDAVGQAQPLLSVKIIWNKEKRRAFVKGLSVAVILCLVAVIGWWALTGWDCIPLTAEDFVVLRLAEYDNGNIQIRTTTAYQGCRSEIRYVPEENALYEVRKRPILAQRKGLPDESVLYAGMLSNYQGGWGEISFDPDGEEIWSGEDGQLLPIKAYYIGVPGSEDAVLIWQEGMELPPATAEDEAWYQEIMGTQSRHAE